MHQTWYFCTKYFTESISNLIEHNPTKPNVALPTTYEPTTFIPKTHQTASYNLKTYQFIWCSGTKVITQNNYHYLVPTYHIWTSSVITQWKAWHVSVRKSARSAATMHQTALWYKKRCVRTNAKAVDFHFWEAHSSMLLPMTLRLIVW